MTASSAPAGFRPAVFEAEVVDLFAGPGGWDVAARRLGFDPTGIEFEHTACETRRAAGFPTVEGDVRDYGPRLFPALVGLIASPPCQTFSMAGKGAGRAALDQVLGLLRGMASGVLPDYSTLSDDRTGLVLDPLRWVLEACALGRPLRWVVLEQVPTVLPVWQAYAEVLRGIGYRVETAVLNAEQYGVPQTRRRAVLVARYNADVSLPIPTHSRYYPTAKKKGTFDAGVLPWVSMAQALELTEQHRLVSPMNPDRTVMRDTDQPAPTHAPGKSAAWSLVPSSEVPEDADTHYWRNIRMRASFTSNGYDQAPLRSAQEPAATITGKVRSFVWFAGAGQTAIDTAGQRRRRDDEPAHTVTGVGSATWTDETSRTGGVRVTVEEAAALQSFPPDHPWRGSPTSRYQQVGNAVPPLLAEAVLKAVVFTP